MTPRTLSRAEALREEEEARAREVASLSRRRSLIGEAAFQKATSPSPPVSAGATPASAGPRVKSLVEEAAAERAKNPSPAGSEGPPSAARTPASVTSILNSDDAALTLTPGSQRLLNPASFDRRKVCSLPSAALLLLPFLPPAAAAATVSNAACRRPQPAAAQRCAQL